MFRTKLLYLFLASLLLSGCTLSLGIGNGSKLPSNGGLFKSTDHGQTWVARNSILGTNGQNLSMNNLKVYSMAMDPSDNRALYLGLFEKGIMTSYDGAESWSPSRSKSLNVEVIVDLAVDPKDKCQLYASVGAKIMKTVDCGRSWQVTYTDANPNGVVRSLAIDHYNPAIIYIGTDNGNLLQSKDYGVSWQNIQIFKNEVKKIVINSADSRIVLVGLSNGRLYRTNDSGVNWVELSDKFKQFKGDRSLRDLIAIPSQDGGFLLALKYGLLKTVNNGEDWTEIKLLTPKNPVTINALAVNYKNPQLIYYITDSTFYRSIDGGENWTTTQIPTTRRAWRILADPLQDGLIYLGVRE